MPGCRVKSEFLGPEDLALCQRVFDQLRASAQSSGMDCEVLALKVLTAFQQGVTDESALVAEVRAKYKELLKRTG